MSGWLPETPLANLLLGLALIAAVPLCGMVVRAYERATQDPRPTPRPDGADPIYEVREQAQDTAPRKPVASHRMVIPLLTDVIEGSEEPGAARPPWRRVEPEALQRSLF